jgi:N-acetylglutamate synthase-like GNAT family acetyltransferase
VIRVATTEDVPRIVEMGMAFAEDSEYADKLPVTAAHLDAMAANLIDGPTSDVLVAEKQGRVVGMVALTVYRHPMTGLLVASELAWWVDADARGSLGVRLLRAAEAWARAHHAAHLTMIAPNDHVAKFYGAVGFQKAETVFEKRL